jgi:hypothetical protein
MDKPEARAAHDLMLRRIAQGLRDEDRDNARAWIGKSANLRLTTMFELSEFNRTMARKHGASLDNEEPEFPRLRQAVA